MKWLFASMALAVVMPLAAAAREGLQGEREVIEIEHAWQADACRKQFAVTSCLDKARLEKQKALGQMAAQEHALNLAERRGRAEAREKRLVGKVIAAQPRVGGLVAAEMNPAPTASAAAPRRSPKPQPEPPPDRSAQEQEKRRVFEARQREIEVHRQKVEQRNAESTRKKPMARPLPLPASAAGNN